VGLLPICAKPMQIWEFRAIGGRRRVLA